MSANLLYKRRIKITVRSSRGPEPLLVRVTPREWRILDEIVHCRNSPQYEVIRAKIILMATDGVRNQRIADELGIHEQTVRKWRSRWDKAFTQMTECESEASDKDLYNFVWNVLADDPRSGRPGTFTPEQICQIVAVACESPEASGRPVTHWTPRELADEAMKRGIVESISVRSVGRFLKRSGLKTS
jgi:putative transposase